MDRARAKQLAPIIKAFGDGEDIQWRGCLDLRGSDDEWATMPTDPLLITTFPADDYEYRIKPKPREWLLAKSGKEYCVTEGVRSPGKVIKVLTDNAEIIKVREVL